MAVEMVAKSDERMVEMKVVSRVVSKAASKAGPKVVHLVGS